MEREYDLLQKINKRKDAVKKYERSKRKEREAREDKKDERQKQTEEFEIRREDEKKRLERQLKKKEKALNMKIQEIENKRLAEMEVKRERQRLVMEDAQKKQDIQKRNANFKKLEVLDKHQRIGDLCTKLDSDKKTFIEHSRIANEIRVKKMATLSSPPKNKSSKFSPSKGSGNKDGAQNV